MSYRTLQTPCPYVNIMSRAAFKAAKALVRDFGEIEHLQISQKGAEDFVTSADRRSEKTIYRELRTAYPESSFVMEEQGCITGTNSLTFVVDPLDGTLNFLHSLPHFAISVGLMESGKPLAGVIFDPIRDEFFWASKGLGAFLNGRRLRTALTEKPYTHLITTSHATLPNNAFPPFDHGVHVRTSGSAVLDLAYVAAGRLDGFLGYGLKPWDKAAGAILIQEAKGYIQDIPTKKEERYTVAAPIWMNPHLTKIAKQLATQHGEK